MKPNNIPGKFFTIKSEPLAPPVSICRRFDASPGQANQYEGN